MTAPPGPASDQLGASVAERGGAVLVGPAGVGKTQLARAASRHLGPLYPRVGWVTGTASARAVPFAAFSNLISGFIIQWYGYPAGFLSLTAVALAAFGFFALFMPETRGRTKPNVALIAPLAVGAC